MEALGEAESVSDELVEGDAAVLCDGVFVAIVADADTDGDCDGDPVVLCDGDVETSGDALVDCDRLCDGDELVDADALGEGDGERDARLDGDTEAEADTEPLTLGAATDGVASEPLVDARPEADTQFVDAAEREGDMLARRVREGVPELDRDTLAHLDGEGEGERLVLALAHTLTRAEEEAVED
jgi:hypothetical protein